jgi:hypothetical protein
MQRIQKHVGQPTSTFYVRQLCHVLRVYPTLKSCAELSSLHHDGQTAICESGRFLPSSRSVLYEVCELGVITL